MPVYLGGQIQREQRGLLASVIYQNKNSAEYRTFLGSIDSIEFPSFTGIRSLKNPVERVYIGITSNAGQEIQKIELEQNPLFMDLLDKMLVNSSSVNLLLYFGGQIKEEHRGSMAALVYKCKHRSSFDLCLSDLNKEDEWEEFNTRTGVRGLQEPIQRAYVGINLYVARKIEKSYLSNLSILDRLIVNSGFLT